MSTLDDLNAGPGGMAGFVGSLSRRLRPVSRRDVLVGATVAGHGAGHQAQGLRPRPGRGLRHHLRARQHREQRVDGLLRDRQQGRQRLPAGQLRRGLVEGRRLVVVRWRLPLHRRLQRVSCSKCTTGCSDGICDSRCWSCSCGTGSTATCDQRRICCNAFRYGQCNTQVKCSGGVHCRVVSCVAPYQWTNCTTTSLQDNRTSEHSAPACPQWGPIYAEVPRDGRAGRRSSRPRPGRGGSVGDGRGSYVAYQGGSIYWTPTTGAVPVTNVRHDRLVRAVGGPAGLLGYPIADLVTGLPDGGWIQIFEQRRHHRLRRAPRPRSSTAAP